MKFLTHTVQNRPLRPSNEYLIKKGKIFSEDLEKGPKGVVDVESQPVGVVSFKDKRPVIEAGHDKTGRVTITNISSGEGKPHIMVGGEEAPEGGFWHQQHEVASRGGFLGKPGQSVTMKPSFPEPVSRQWVDAPFVGKVPREAAGLNIWKPAAESAVTGAATILAGGAQLTPFTPAIRTAVSYPVKYFKERIGGFSPKEAGERSMRETKQEARVISKETGGLFGPIGREVTGLLGGLTGAIGDEGYWEGEPPSKRISPIGPIRTFKQEPSKPKPTTTGSKNPTQVDVSKPAPKDVTPDAVRAARERATQLLPRGAVRNPTVQQGREWQ